MLSFCILKFVLVGGGFRYENKKSINCFVLFVLILEKEVIGILCLNWEVFKGELVDLIFIFCF